LAKTLGAGVNPWAPRDEMGKPNGFDHATVTGIARG